MVCGLADGRQPGERGSGGFNSRDVQTSLVRCRLRPRKRLSQALLRNAGPHANAAGPEPVSGAAGAKSGSGRPALANTGRDREQGTAGRQFVLRRGLAWGGDAEPPPRLECRCGLEGASVCQAFPLGAPPDVEGQLAPAPARRVSSLEPASFSGAWRGSRGSPLAGGDDAVSSGARQKDSSTWLLFLWRPVQWYKYNTARRKAGRARAVLPGAPHHPPVLSGLRREGSSCRRPERSGPS